jgi:hypothetical protein
VKPPGVKVRAINGLPPAIDAREGLEIVAVEDGHLLTFRPQVGITAAEIAVLLPLFISMSIRPVTGVTQWLEKTGLNRHFSRVEIPSG